MSFDRIPERDWKQLRAMKDGLLNAACDSILAKARALTERTDISRHEAYLKLWKLLRTEDREIAAMFDDLRRSNAIFKLEAWRRNGLLTDERLERFSDSTRAALEDIVRR